MWWLFFPLCLIATWLVFIFQPTPQESAPARIPTETMTELTFEKPPVVPHGRMHSMSIEQIRWCLREDIILNAGHQAITSREMADEYNARTAAYNERCRAFRYQGDDLQRAQRQIEMRRDEITATVRRRASSDDRTLPAATPAPGASGAALNAHGLHDYNAAALCGRTPTRAIAQKRSQSIYRWVDDKGVTHYSQRGGGQAEYIGDQYKTRAPLFDLTVEFSGDRRDPVTREAIYQDAHRVYGTLKELINQPHWRHVSLDIILYTDKAEFAAQQRKAGLSGWAGAFFSGRENRVYMLYTPEKRDRMLSIARHEVSHALLAGMTGPSPSWLNEGLAEYMELGGHGRSDHSGLRSADDLQRLLTLSPKQFYGQSRKRNYTQAYALIKHLMSRTQGKQVISHFLNDLAADPCTKLDSPAVLARTYTDGLEQLAREMGL